MKATHEATLPLFAFGEDTYLGLLLLSPVRCCPCYPCYPC